MTFPNPRLHTIPAERLRARCVLAESFVSRECVEDNGGYSSPGGVVINRGVTVSNPAAVIQSPTLVCKNNEKISIFVRISCNGGSFGFYGSVIRLQFIDGFVYADHTAGTTSSTIAVEYDYDDGKVHEVMYAVDLSSGLHRLFVNGVVYEESTSVSGAINEGTVTINGSASYSVFRELIFNDVLNADDFAVLSDERYTDFLFKNLYAFWRCNARSHDSIGNYLRDTHGNTKFVLGDGSTGSTIPTAGGDNGEEFVEFDALQYLSDEPDFPDDYTVSVAHSDTVFDGRFPSVTQEDNAKTIVESMQTAGSYAYENLHSIWVSDRQLKPIEKLHLQHSQLYDNWRSSCRGAVHQLINEGICRVALMFNCPTMMRDIAYESPRYGQKFNVTTNGTEFYSEFNVSTSNILMPNLSGDEDLRESTWIVFGELIPAVSTKYIMGKNTTLWQQTSSTLSVGGSSISSSVINNASEMLAFSAVHNYKPRFFANDVFAGEGDVNISLPSNESSSWILGNGDSLGYPFFGNKVKAFLVFNVALADREIISIYHSLKRSFGYVRPQYSVGTIWFDKPGQSEIKVDDIGNSTIINDEVA